MRVALRTSAGKDIGFGHLRRCMTLAEALRDHGARSVFSIDGDGEAVRLAESAGFEAHHVPMDHIPAGATIIVVDTYRVDADYLTAAAETGARLVVIDDLADRRLDEAEVVINTALGADTLPYPKNGRTRLLLGPAYALLRPEYGSEPSKPISRRVCRVLVTAGGSDPRGLTRKLAQWTSQALGDAHVDVVVGPFADIAPGRSLVRPRVAIHRDPSCMHELMVGADVAVSAGGQTLYELAACATPAIAIQVADNQANNINRLAAAGAVIAAGSAEQPDLEFRVKEALVSLDTRPELRASMGRRGRHIVDGGGAERVAEEIAS